MLSLKRSGFVVSVVYHAAGVDVSTGAAVSSGFGACLVVSRAFVFFGAVIGSPEFQRWRQTLVARF